MCSRCSHIAFLPLPSPESLVLMYVGSDSYSGHAAGYGDPRFASTAAGEAACGTDGWKIGFHGHAGEAELTTDGPHMLRASEDSWISQTAACVSPEGLFLRGAPGGDEHIDFRMEKISPRSPVPGPRSPVPGPRSPVPGPRSPVPGDRGVAAVPHHHRVSPGAGSGGR